jgi:dTDP-4-amino-4,6-dideoxy-D-galactose acyltransferase
VGDALRAPGAAGILVGGQAGPCGLAVVARRGFESGIFGIECGTLGPVLVDPASCRGPQLEALLDRALDEARRHGLRHVTARVDVVDVELLHHLEARGFLTMDQILHFYGAPGEREAGGAAVPDAGIEVRPPREEDIPALRAIAAAAYRFDRFHADPALPPALADRLYADWIENAVRGHDDHVFVATLDGLPAGFMTARINPETTQALGVTVGKIWLVGVSEAARGRGVAPALMADARRWFGQQGCDVIEVGTQLRNTPALKFYTRCGFSPQNALIALRALL